MFSKGFSADKCIDEWDKCDKLDRGWDEWRGVTSLATTRAIVCSWGAGDNVTTSDRRHWPSPASHWSLRLHNGLWLVKADPRWQFMQTLRLFLSPKSHAPGSLCPDKNPDVTRNHLRVGAGGWLCNGYLLRASIFWSPETLWQTFSRTSN